MGIAEALSDVPEPVFPKWYMPNPYTADIEGTELLVQPPAVLFGASPYQGNCNDASQPIANESTATALSSAPSPKSGEPPAASVDGMLGNATLQRTLDDTLAKPRVSSSDW